MADTNPTVEIRGAVQELQRYLCDEMAPMMVTDSVLVLMDQPPELVAPQINAWVGAQYSRGDTRYTTADYIYHALKKLHLICEFQLIDAERLRAYLQRLAAQMLAFCPEEDRERLRQQLEHLGDAEATATSAPVEQIYHAGGAKAPRATAAGSVPAPGAPGREPADDSINRGLRRFSLLLERLGRSDTVGVQTRKAPEVEQVQMQALVTAAVGARDESELQELIRQLGGAGIDARSEQLFQLLGRSLPAWNIPLAAPGGATYTNRPLEAMRKMVALAETPQEWARRFNDLVLAAIDQFNEGSLARAATMLDLAEGMLVGKGQHQDVVQAIRRRAHEAIKEDQLRKYAERPEDRRVLLRFMNFFSAMTPEGLLRQLHDEKKRERRWLLLLLLEAHGAKARAAALKEIDEYMRGDRSEPEGYHQRNLVHLLRRIPAGDAGPGEKEMEALTRFSKVDQPSILIREAIRTLAKQRTSAAERILLARLREFEAAALKQGPVEPSPDGKPNAIHELLDSVCSALASHRTAGATGAVLFHGLREEPALGDAAARLDVLGAEDLSSVPETVERLLRALRERLPKKILGLVIQKRENLGHLIRALAGTPLPDVRTALEEIASKYASQDLGAEAARVLASSRAAGQRGEQPAPGLSGDIELFGLPNLFQSFADSRINGTLTLRDGRGQVCSTIRFRDGKIRSSEYLHIKGTDAAYQLFEKPGACKFTFHAEAAPPAEPPPADLIEVVPMLMEAMRRHDELQQARAMVPDGARLQSTGAKPTRHSEEEDIEITKAVWSKALSGSTPEQCETQVPADAFRIRRLLVHWVESGALKIAAPTPTAAAGQAAAAAGAPRPA